MQIIGLCRFSYPAIGGFQVEHDSLEERMAYLWSEARLEERFRLLETMALPCLRVQTDPNFQLIMLIGDRFPAHHEARLRDLTADIPQIQIRKEPPQRSRAICKRVLNQARHTIHAPCIQFRHDDDDAIAVDFIEKLRQASKDVASLLDKHEMVALDWNQGYVAEVGAQGLQATPIYRPFYVAALGVYVAGGCRTSIHNFNHEKLPQVMPTVTFSDPDMFVRSHNGFNDSRQKKVRAVPVEPLSAEQTRLFKSRFAIDVEEVRAVFSRP